ncbi:disease resistance-like protein DSC1 [Humulus lupulus]|uniref:disease resistance-like protein DSC1 n=1 Tax=Humulus lupulus TaxID=3486 RepID=UPI002B407181|nr:disease resistance-like protein DSC1 [Humulus lupulus]
MSSSSSSIFTPKKYDVYVNFRSENANKTFVSNLYASLHRRKIHTSYVDFDDPKGTEEISPGMVKAIEESKLGIIIFSENYGSSPKCLDELVHILECNKEKQQFVIPLFYHVDPSHVRDQLESFARVIKWRRRVSEAKKTDLTTAPAIIYETGGDDDFRSLVQALTSGQFTSSTVKYEPDRVEKWKLALEAAANLSSLSTSSTNVSESELVELVVEAVVNKLEQLKSLDNTSQCLVGIEPRVEKIVSLLHIGSPEVRIIGIWGMGGIGKTTLARVVYERVASQFESSCFLENVQEVSRSRGLNNLRNELLAELFEEESDQYLDNYSSFGSTLLAYRRKRVLTVLDDVNNLNQFELLARDHDLFGYGSRIIITTRNMQVLRNIGANEVYRVEELNQEDAFQLFCSIAFRESNFSKTDYIEFSEEIVDNVQGHPLALIVLASCLKYKSKQDWESALTKLKKIPNIGIQNVLKISYDELDNYEKSLFLDVACFFRSENREIVENVLDSRDFFTSNQLNDLRDKFLLTFDAHKNIKMHDLIAEMACQIVLRERKKSRLVTAEDILHISKHSTESAATHVEGICLDMCENREIQFSPSVFKKMNSLRLLKIHFSNPEKCKVNFSPGLPSLPKSLRYLHWDASPLKSLPEDFPLENLVELIMPYSNFETMWDGDQDLVNLKKIDLSYSVRLTHIPSLTRAQNLQYLKLEYCKSLTELPSHLQHLPELTTISLSGCSSLDKFPQLPKKLKSLYMSGTSIYEVPSSIEYLTNLEVLLLSDCERLESLPTTLSKLLSLEYLNMDGCSNLSRLPEILGPMEDLMFLFLNNTAIKTLPSTIENLVNLETLDLRRCRELELIPTSIYQLENLKLLNVSGCMKLNKLPPMSVGLQSLSRLNLSDCSLLEIPDQLGALASLESLDLSGSIIDRVPTSINKLLKLKHLDISNCKNLRALPEIPLFVEFVDAHGCISLKTMSTVSKLALTQGWDHFPVRSEELVFFNCLRLDHNARNNLMNDGRLRILRMATFSRSKQVPEYSSVSICYPGYQIPKWFNYRCRGSSIHVKLRPQWWNSNFLGFSLCLVAAPFSECDSHTQIHFHCELKFRDKNGKTHTFKSFLRGYSQDNDEDTSIRWLNSDHLFLWYDYGLCLHELEADTFTEAWFEFFAIDSWDRKVNSCEVKKCGIHLLYRQEAARFGFPTGVSEQSDEIIEICDSDNDDDDTTMSAGIDYDNIMNEEEEDQQPTEIYRRKSNFSGCAWIISLIKEFCEHGFVKKSGYDDHVTLGDGLRQQGNTSTFRATEAHIEKHFKENSMHSMKLKVEELNQKAEQILKLLIK